MYFPQMLRVHFEKNPCCKEQAIKWTKARVYVYSDSVLCLGNQHGPEDAIRRWNDQVLSLKMCPTFRELQGLGGDPTDIEVEDLPRSHCIGHSQRNSGRSARKARHT